MEELCGPGRPGKARGRWRRHSEEEEGVTRMKRTEGGAGWMGRIEKRTGWMYGSKVGPGVDEEARGKRNRAVISRSYGEGWMERAEETC